MMEAVSGDETGYRPGARHAILVYGKGATLEDARTDTVSFVTLCGWLHVEVKRMKHISNDTTVIQDTILRESAEVAMQKGQAIVIYGDEIPPNA